MDRGYFLHLALTGVLSTAFFVVLVRLFTHKWIGWRTAVVYVAVLVATMLVLDHFKVADFLLAQLNVH